MRRDPQNVDVAVLTAEFASDNRRVAGSPGFLAEGVASICSYLSQFDLFDGHATSPTLLAEMEKLWQTSGAVIDARMPDGRFRKLCCQGLSSGGIILTSIDNTTQHHRDALARRVLELHPMALWINAVKSGDVLYRNQQARTLFEIEGQSDTEGHIDEMLPNRADNMRLLRELRAHGQLENQVMQAKTQRGRDLWVYGAWSLFPFEDEEAILSVVQDATTLKQHEVESHRVRDLLNDALRGLNEGCALFDEDGRLIVCNDRYRHLNGGIQEFISPGIHWETLLTETARRGQIRHAKGREPAWVAQILQASERTDSFDIERTDGTITSVTVRPTSLGGFIVSEVDITARRRAERVADESEQLLSTLLEASPANLCMSQLGDGSIVYQSPASVDLFGHADSARDQFADPLDRADFLTELLASDRIDDFPATARRADGSTFPAIFSARIIDYRNDDVMVSTVTDLTEQVAAEHTIKAASERLRDAIEALSEGFILYDAEERVVMANQRFLEMNAPYADQIKPGTHTRVLLQAAVDSGHIVDAKGWLDDYEAELARGQGGSHRSFEFQIADGTRITSVRRPTREGGFVITWLDVTDERNAAADLALSNDRLRDAIDSVDEGFALFDPDDRLVMWNRRYEELNAHVADRIQRGAHFRDILRRSLDTDLLEPEAAEQTRAYVAHGNYRLRAREEFQLRNGNWYSVAHSPTSEGGFVVTRHDITQQKRAAADLQRMADRMRDAIDSIDEGFALYDADLRLVMWNEKYEELNEHVPDSVRQGISMQERLQKALASDQLTDRTEELLRGALEGGLKIPRSREEFEMKDGRWFSVMRSPTTEGGLVITRLDITEQKHAAAEMQRLNDRLRDAIESLDVGFALFDAEDRLVVWNERYGALNKSISHVLRDGVTYQDILETAIHTNKLPESEAASVRATGSRLRGNNRLQYEYQAQAGDWFSVTRNPTSENGFVITRADITERKLAESELTRQRDMLHQSEKMSALGELLAGVAHELNNPLSVVVGHALMMEEEIDDPALLKRTKKISTAAERCSRIVKTFLSMARQRPMKLELTAINTVIETALDVAGYGLRSAGVVTDCRLAGDLPPVRADADQLVQVLANLIVNAEHALGKLGAEGRLTLATRLSRSGNDVVIDVIDNGPGIPEKIRARIFEPFFTTKDVGDGTGVGLAFCHRVIDTHDGSIEVNEAKDGGAHFTVRLAVATPEPERAGDSIAETQGAGQVLVIDDEYDVAELISHILDRDGYSVTTVHSAEAALALLPGSFDLILSDINMPGLDGKDLLSDIKQRWPGLEGRLGFITGDTMSPGAEQFLAQAQRPYLEKPITPVDLRGLAAGIVGAQAQARG